jgi:hypothetical protein
VGGAAVFSSSGAYSSAPERVMPTAADSLVGPTNVTQGTGAEPRGRRAATPPP